ncbi:MAG: glycosyltransferase [Termitinemataceae bacterium]|nr:MAG: glycosyltransferase [Termitinemataceae bacterium]
MKQNKKILINGCFLCRQLTGIERYAYEITTRLDNLISHHEVAIIFPANTINIPNYKNLEVIIHKKKIYSTFYWQHITLQSFLLKHKQYMVLDFSNTALPFAPGIVFLHDIYCEFYKEDFNGLRDKLVQIYNKLEYRLIAYRAKKIATVSNFSKNQIAETYHIDPDKISVIYNGWDHFKEIKSDYSIFEDYPALLEKPFYFSLGSISKRKNIQWIVKYATKNPDAFFAISGGELPTTKDSNVNNAVLLENIMLLGYLSDEKVKALMEKCTAFILPSYYEGFGIPPLEALSCGAQIIIANAASLPEIYGNTAHYIDPFNTDVDLNTLLQEPVERPTTILKKYSYDTSAQKVFELLSFTTGKPH